MKVLWEPRAASVLRHLEPSVRKRLKHALRLLAQDPSGRSARLDVKRLDTDDGAGIYRLRVGDWRMGFTIDGAVLVLRIFHRDEGYGWLVDMA
ncbi:MAG: type II toxin-antitoxin system RelE/ParE family toxin [Thermoplasmatota archaeon]|nr:type II toxin-antitoxin system RelE/ParE family toxin [Halobacteriales archaeon]